MTPSPSTPESSLAISTQPWSRSQMWRPFSPSTAEWWAALFTRAMPSYSTPTRGTHVLLSWARMGVCLLARRLVSLFLSHFRCPGATQVGCSLGDGQGIARPRSNWDVNLQVGVRSNNGERARHNSVMTKQVHSDNAGLGPGWEVSQWVRISRVHG